MSYKVEIEEAWAGAEKALELPSQHLPTVKGVKSYLTQLSKKYKRGILNLTIESPKAIRPISIQIVHGEITPLQEKRPLEQLLQETYLTHPATYYHVTANENLPNIRARGLRPGAGKGEYLLGEGALPRKYVYLFRYEEDAEEYATDLAERGMKDTTILQVKVRQTMYPDEEMHGGEGDVTYVRKPIPPEDISS